MKKWVCLVLAAVMAAACVLPVGATEGTEGAADPAPVVYTVEGLLTAIDAATDGDVVYIGDNIFLEDDLTIGAEEKHIFLVRGEDFNENCMFSCSQGSVAFENLTIDGNGAASSAIITNTDLRLKNVCIKNNGESAVSVLEGKLFAEDCRFEDNEAEAGAHLWLITGASAEIEGSSFINGIAWMRSGGAIRSSGDLLISDCVFSNNNSVGGGGAIYTTRGKCEIENCIITGNSTSGAGGGGGIFNGGTLILSDTKICENTATLCGADIFSNGNMEISISGNDLEDLYRVDDRVPLGFYADFSDGRFDGETNVTEAKTLPLSIEGGTSALIFVFEDDISAHEAEAQTAPEETEEAVESDGQDEGAAVVPETFPESDTVGFFESWPDDSTAPASGVIEIQAPAEVPKSEAPALICGGAVLDLKNRAYLLGYGDGVIGEDDFITRAQIAQIFYGLLTEDSRAALDGAGSGFADVPPAAWYHPRSAPLPAPASW